MTLVEVLVAVFLLAIVGTIISGIVIAAMHLTRTTSSGVKGQSELNDAVSRITRDIASADPILSTSTGAGWAKNTPAADELWTQSVANDKCTRTRYWVNTNGTKKELKSTTQTYASNACPDPRLPDATTTAQTKTLISDLKTTNDAGAQVSLFTYYKKDNVVLAPVVSRANVPNIARVKIDVGSNVEDRAKGVRLVTSVAPRSMDSPVFTNVPLPDCAEANLTAVRPAANPLTPVVTWDATNNADLFTLSRTAPTAYAWTAVAANPGTVTDTAMRGRWNVPINYTLDIVGPGGSVTCTFPLAPNPPSALTAPPLTVTLTPNTAGGPGTVTTPTVNLSWTAPSDPVTGYDIYRRAIDGNLSPYNNTTSNVWTKVASTTSTTWTNAPGFNQAFEYMVQAVNDDWIPSLVSPASNVGKVLTHTDSVTVSGVAFDYGTNRITWTADAGTTAEGYTVYRRVNGTTPWQAAAVCTKPIGTLTCDDTSAALGTRYDYMVTSYNDGPRGTGTNAGTIRYYGQASNIINVLQFPANPVTTATGTEPVTVGGANNAYNPDGQNTANWGPIPSATTYEVYKYGDAALTPATLVASGLTTLSRAETGQVRGTRTYYMAVACNATGCSENKFVLAQRAADIAYQRPVAPVVSAPVVPTLATNDIAFNYVNSADAGESTDKFCATATLCSYEIDRDAALVTKQTGNPPVTYAADLDDSTASAFWGTTKNWTVEACNPGGCSGVDATSTVAMKHYPGPFSYTSTPSDIELDHWQWTEAPDTIDHTRTSAGTGQAAMLTVGWQDSKGVRPASSYRFIMTEKADDPQDLRTDEYVVTSASTKNYVTPGANYNLYVDAYAANGLIRRVQSDYQTAPAPSTFFESTHACKESITDGANGGWKAIYRYRLSTGINRSGAMVGTYEYNFKATEIVGNRTTATFANLADWADTAEAAGGSSVGTTTQWKNMSNGQYFWHTDVSTAAAATTGERNSVAGGMSDDGYYLPPVGGAGSFNRARTQISNSSTHAATWGDWSGYAIGDAEWDNVAGHGCPGYGSWTGDPAFISRWALRGHSYAINPNTVAGNTWGTIA